MANYNTTIQLLMAFNVAESTIIRGILKIHFIKKLERKILRNIDRVVLKEGIWIKRPSEKLCKSNNRYNQEMAIEILRKFIQG